jgi:predicted methyltransferase
MVRITYTHDMAIKVRNIKPPVKNLVLDIRARPNYLALTVYESNIMEYNESQRMAIMDYLLLVRELIQSYGTPCEIEGMKYTDEQARQRRGQR